MEEFARWGGTHLFATPGSRSAPLTIAADRHDRLRLVMCIDERTASFAALGHARMTGIPAAVITTSGTAVANLLPAIVEASQADVPLLALTADRPPELHECGANQTIRQSGIFGSFVRHEATLPLPQSGMNARAWLSMVDAAVSATLSPRRGPVHLNCPFAEPLDPTASAWTFAKGSDLARWRESTAPWRSSHRAHCGFRDPSHCEQLFIAAKRPVIVVGAIDDPEEAYHARALAQRSPWPVIADIASGLRTPGVPPRTLRHGTLLLRAAAEQGAGRLPPADLVLRLGGACAWRHVDEWCARAPRLIVAGGGTRFDPLHAASDHLEVSCAELAALEVWKDCDASSTLAAWERADQAADAAVRQSLTDVPAVSEIAVAQALLRSIPENAAFFVGSSMPVRDVDACGGAAERGFRVVANRGASGIDGGFASLAGLAHADVSCAIGLLGDVAALHDLSSLDLLARCQVPVVVFVVNNDGGGIFEALPIAKHGDLAQRLFVAPHGRRMKAAAELFGIRYVAASRLDDIATAINTGMRRRDVSLCEVTVDRAKSVAARRALLERVAAALPKR